MGDLQSPQKGRAVLKMCNSKLPRLGITSTTRIFPWKIAPFLVHSQVFQGLSRSSRTPGDLWSQSAHVLDGILISQPIGTLHGVIGVPTPVILSDSMVRWRAIFEELNWNVWFGMLLLLLDISWYDVRCVVFPLRSHVFRGGFANVCVTSMLTQLTTVNRDFHLQISTAGLGHVGQSTVDATWPLGWLRCWQLLYDTL